MKNKVIRGEETSVIIMNSKGNELECVVDTEDLDRICQAFKGTIFPTWSTGKEHLIYACGVINGIRVRLHRFLMDASEGVVVDHIDGNTLKNIKENLRTTTHTVNARNIHKMYDRNVSGCRGVSWEKDRQKWRAYIFVDNKKVTLGQFENKEDAIESRKQAEIKYWGEER